MKFLVRSGCGESLAIALKLRQEGNQVRFAISEEADETYHLIGEGLIEKSTLGKSIDWADVIVFDSNIFDLPKEAEAIRKHQPVLGSSGLSGDLENDRAFAVAVAKSAGLNVPDYKEFSGLDAWSKAKVFLQSQTVKEGWVWKPNGESPASTFVAADVDQMLHMFDYWKKLYKEHKEEASFILTTKIEGEEISTEGWFNGKDFFLFNHTLERTRFFDGDHGEKTGCAGNVVWGHDGPLFGELIEPVGKFIAGKYRGPIDVNAIIDKNINKPIFLEFTPRFGYDAIFGMVQALDSDVGELFYEVATGGSVTAKVRSDFAGAVRVHIPPYPEAPAKDDDLRPVGLPVKGWKVNGEIGPVYPVEIYEKDGVFTSGPDGYVMVVGGNGKTPKAAMESAYEGVDKIEIPLMRYRLDLADKLEEVYGKLTKTGWLGKTRAFGRNSK